VLLPSVPDGRYYLRVQPEGPLDPGPVTGFEGRAIGYTIALRRDVPNGTFFFLAFFALLLPPVITGVRAWGFEHTRWQESDYAATSGDSDDDE
jgi:hypothetical protein